jgi:hypothetical protein
MRQGREVTHGPLRSTWRWLPTRLRAVLLFAGRELLDSRPVLH